MRRSAFSFCLPVPRPAHCNTKRPPQNSSARALQAYRQSCRTVLQLFDKKGADCIQNRQNHHADVSENRNPHIRKTDCRQ